MMASTLRLLALTTLCVCLMAWVGLGEPLAPATGATIPEDDARHINITIGASSCFPRRSFVAAGLGGAN